MGAKTHLARLIAGSVLVSTVSMGASAAGIQNGDFEGAPPLSNWTANNPPINANNSQDSSPFIDSKAAELGSGTAADPDVLFQNFATVAGQVYQVTFSYIFASNNTPKNGYDNFFRAFISDTGTSSILATLVSIADVSSAGATITASFAATGSQSRLTFEAWDNGSGNNDAFFVDNVSVTAVPGPLAGAGLPVLAALAGYGWLRRRRAA